MRHKHKITGRAFRIGKPFIQFYRMCCRDLLNFIFPPVCPACDERKETVNPVCNLCFQNLEKSLKVIIQKKAENFQHLKSALFFDEILTCWEFTPQIEKLIHCLKYRRGSKIGLSLGLMIAPKVVDNRMIDKESILIPVPLHKLRYRERGFNQSEIICRSIGSTVSIPVETDILVRTRNTFTQTKLEAEERIRNVNEAFRVRDPNSVQSRTVILVDDVVTTTSTELLKDFKFNHRIVV